MIAITIIVIIRIIIIIIIFIKEGRKCKAGKEFLAPYQSKDPSPTIPTIEIKKRKGKQKLTKGEPSA